VTFRYKQEIDPKAIPQFGLVAEEVEQANPDLVVRDAEGKVYTVRYEAVSVMLLNEFLKEHCKVEEQERKIQEQEGQMQEEKATITQLNATVIEQQKTVEALAAGLKEQARQIQKVSAQLEMGKSAPQMVDNN
jgi:predicted RNase H-like nuclease (RuvC/YqgF family)